VRRISPLRFGCARAFLDQWVLCRLCVGNVGLGALSATHVPLLSHSSTSAVAAEATHQTSRRYGALRREAWLPHWTSARKHETGTLQDTSRAITWLEFSRHNLREPGSPPPIREAAGGRYPPRPSAADTGSRYYRACGSADRRY